jgi:hypothetical protein
LFTLSFEGPTLLTPIKADAFTIAYNPAAIAASQIDSREKLIAAVRR